MSIEKVVIEIVITYNVTKPRTLFNVCSLNGYILPYVKRRVVDSSDFKRNSVNSKIKW